MLLERTQLTDSVDLQLPPSEMRMKLVEIRHHSELVGNGQKTHVGGLDHPWNSQLFASFESFLAVANNVRWGQCV